jgi:predicted Na+-dependent transporter
LTVPQLGGRGVDPVQWYQVKLFVQHATGWSMDALHVVLGVLLQLLVAGLLKSSVSRVLPLAAVLAAAVLNEWSDLALEQWPDAGIQYGESVKDIILTMLLPVMLHLLARRRAAVLR